MVSKFRDKGTDVVRAKGVTAWDTPDRNQGKHLITQNKTQSNPTNIKPQDEASSEGDMIAQNKSYYIQNKSLLN